MSDVKDADHFYLDRKGQSALLMTLKSIPDLVEDLAITETKQGHTMKRGVTDSRRPKKLGYRVPHHEAAFAAGEALRNELGGWVRLVHEQRGLAIECGDNILTLTAWLDKNIITLAMTEGVETAAVDIQFRVAAVKKVIDIPPDDVIVINEAKIKEANRQVVTSGYVEKIAGKLGAVGKGLTASRVRYLSRNGVLKAVGSDGDTQFYRLGDVLFAHVQTIKKRRKSKSA